MKFIDKLKLNVMLVLLIYITIEVISYFQAKERLKNVVIFEINESEQTEEIDVSTFSEEEIDNLMLNSLLEEYVNEENQSLK